MLAGLEEVLAMKLVLTLCALSVAAVAVRASGWRSSKAEDPPARAATIADFAWLAGGWTTKGERTTTEEHWIAPAGKTMLGVGRTVSGDKTLFFEFLRLEERADGVHYVAHPNASSGTDFRLTSWSASEFRVENPSHDFPRSIRYTRKEDGSVVAHLEGVQGEQPAAQDVVYVRLER